MKIYLAGSIFYYGDVLRNTEWAKKIRDAFPGVDLYSPIENTDINGTEGKKKFAGSQLIANGDNARLDQTDILVVCIDGDSIPSGSSAEIGKMHEKCARGDHKYIVGICTDNRQMYLTHSAAKDEGGAAALGEQQYSYQNLYVTGLIKQAGVLVSTIDDAINFIRLHKHEFDTTVSQADRESFWNEGETQMDVKTPVITAITNFPSDYRPSCDIILSNNKLINLEFSSVPRMEIFLNTFDVGDEYNEKRISKFGTLLEVKCHE